MSTRQKLLDALVDEMVSEDLWYRAEVDDDREVMLVVELGPNEDMWLKTSVEAPHYQLERTVWVEKSIREMTEEVIGGLNNPKDVVAVVKAYLIRRHG